MQSPERSSSVDEEELNLGMFEVARGAIYWALENSGPNHVEPRILDRPFLDRKPHDVVVVIGNTHYASYSLLIPFI
jgi:hypothetical protein